MFLTTTHRVTSPKWQNENFFTAFPPKDTNSDSHPRTKMPPWKSMSPMEKSQHNIGEKKVILDTLKRTDFGYFRIKNKGTEKCIVLELLIFMCI